MERSATAFTAADRIGQLAVQINDIADTRRMLAAPRLRRRWLGRMTLWSGRVGTELAPEVWEFLRADDDELLPYDIQGTLLHAERLHAAGILDDVELAEVRETLGRLDTVDPAAEDVHSFIEAELGEVGRKIHAGRSRNDQVAAAFRLYVVARVRRSAGGACRVRARRSSSAPRRRPTTPMPGYTHLQRAQPVTLGHHLLAWSEMLERDRARFALRRGAGGAVAARSGRARRLDAPVACAAARDAQLARRGCRPRLRTRLSLRGRGALHAPLAHRRGARPLDDGRVRRSRGCPRRRRRARR